MANPVIINPLLTLAGQAAAFNASNTGIELVIDAISFGRAHYDPTGEEVALVDPVGNKVPLAGGSRPTPYQLRMSAAWKEDVGQVAIGEIGYWSNDVLVFVWSRANGEIASYKTDGVTYVLFCDLAFAQVPANSISLIVDPTESVALAALSEHEGAKNAHPQYLERADVAKDSGRLSWLGEATGTANDLVLKLVAAESKLPALAPGQFFQFKAMKNSTGPVTASVQGLGPIAVKKSGDNGLAELDPGDIKALIVYDLKYDGQYFQLGGGVGGASGQAFQRFSFTASVGQAVFEVPHVPGSLIVMRNGREVTGYVSDAAGTKIVLSIPCNMDDRLDVIAFKSFKVADTYTKPEIAELLKTASQVPVGAMLPFPRGTVPPGFLEVDGSVHSSAAYPDLAAYLGATFNKGDEGAGNFRLPDSRGEFLRGWDHGRGVDAGRNLGSWQADALQNIVGNVGAVRNDGASIAPSGPFANVGAAGNFTNGGGQFSNVTFDASKVVRTGNETRPRNLAVMWCIKAWNAPVNQGNIDVAALAQLAAQATEINQGTAKVATTAQMLDSANDLVMPTPKKLRWGLSVSLASNGYIAAPFWLGGWVIQWGTTGAVSPTPAVVSFPMAFPSEAYVALAIGYLGQTNVGSNQDAIYSFGLSKNGVSFKTYGSVVANGAKYIAIGS